MADLPILFGYFTRFNEWTEINSLFEGHFLERVAPGAFRKTFRELTPKVLFQHGMDPQIGDKVLGPVSELREDADGAYYEVPLLDTAYNRELEPGLREGEYGASFRFTVIREDINDEPEPSDYNPKGLPERTIQEAIVREFGPVTFPAYEGATAALRATGAQPARRRAAKPANGQLAPRFSGAGEIASRTRKALDIERVLRGASRVTPRKPLRLGGETLQPKRSRLALSHPLVIAQPENFEPADRSDTATRTALRGLLRAALHTTERDIATRTRTRRRSGWLGPTPQAGRRWL